MRTYEVSSCGHAERKREVGKLSLGRENDGLRKSREHKTDDDDDEVYQGFLYFVVRCRLN